MSYIKSIRRALFSSIVSLVLCVVMLAGSTFAWFSASITSKNNIIHSGSLDASLYYRDPSDPEYKDASVGAIFNTDLWEPGYIDTKIIKIENSGNLALQYQLNFSSNVEVDEGEPNLADVIDVYIFGASQNVDQSVLNNSIPVGTLSEVINTTNGIIRGVLLPNGSTGNYPVGAVEYCVVLAMRTGLGKEYQNLSVGDGISVKLVATQFNFEEDSFGHRCNGCNKTGSSVA